MTAKIIEQLEREVADLQPLRPYVEDEKYGWDHGWACAISAVRSLLRSKSADVVRLALHGDWQAGDRCFYTWPGVSHPARVLRLTATRIVIQMDGNQHTMQGVRSTTARCLRRPSGGNQPAMEPAKASSASAAP